MKNHLETALARILYNTGTFFKRLNCMSVLPVSMSVYLPCACLIHTEVRRENSFPWNWSLLDCYKPPYGCSKVNTSPLEEDLTAKPSLQPTTQ